MACKVSVWQTNDWDNDARDEKLVVVSMCCFGVIFVNEYNLLFLSRNTKRVPIVKPLATA